MPHGLPNEVFITKEEAGTEDEYLQVHESPRDIAEIDETRVAGHYVLLKPVTVRAIIEVTS